MNNMPRKSSSQPRITALFADRLDRGLSACSQIIERASPTLSTSLYGFLVLKRCPSVTCFPSGLKRLDELLIMHLRSNQARRFEAPPNRL
jgi:hypothetical protein